jgi:uncharacterized membrane protein
MTDLGTSGGVYSVTRDISDTGDAVRLGLDLSLALDLRKDRRVNVNAVNINASSRFHPS